MCVCRSTVGIPELGISVQMFSELQDQSQKLMLTPSIVVAFSRGSRQCLGMHLGSAEIYIGIAGVFRRFGRRMKIVDTVKARDVDISHDFFTPMMEQNTTGIKLMIQEATGAVQT